MKSDLSMFHLDPFEEETHVGCQVTCIFNHMDSM